MLHFLAQTLMHLTMRMNYVQKPEGEYKKQVVFVLAIWSLINQKIIVRSGADLLDKRGSHGYL